MAEALRCKRGQIKGKLTRLNNYICSLANIILNDDIITELTCRLEKFEQPTWADFESVQSELELKFPCEADEKEREDFEKDYFQLITKIKNICSKFKQSNDNTNQAVVSSGSHNSEFSSMHIKLPAIKLKTFDGKYENWLEFRDSFNALVESNSSISQIQKFYYLRSSLEKEPSQIIQSIEVSSSNYDVAWQLLKDRYENKQLIIHNHIHAIFQLPTVAKESYSDLRGLFDNITKHLRALNVLGEQTDAWDRLVIYILTSKFDSVTRREWESYEFKNELPNMSDMNNFLKGKCSILEKIALTIQEKTKQSSDNKRQTNSFPSTSTNFMCFYCNHKSHAIYNCPSFLDLSVEQRITQIKKLKLCLNCLRKNHFSHECRAGKCARCGRGHNSLLHLEGTGNNDQNKQVLANNSETPLPSASNQTTLANHSIRTSSVASQVLLSTANVKIRDNKNNVYTCRALLDSGSQSNFISEQMCKLLKGKVTQVNYAVKGVGTALSNINRQVQVTVYSTVNNFSVDIKCLVLPVITEKLPLEPFDKNILNIPNHLPLADNNFNKPTQIDILLGSSVFWSLLCVGQYKLETNMLRMQKTQLGWIVAGDLSYNENETLSTNYLSINSNFDNIKDETVQQFWQLESINTNANYLSSTEQYCETYFKNTTKRDQNGRFIIKIPFNNLVSNLGDSRKMALDRFKSLERKLTNNLSLKQRYSEFMSDYENLGHMTETEENVIEGSNTHYFLPHHAVVKEISLTTKLRVVFDGSAKTNTGISLNDTQYVGPTIQNDIFSILLRFRSYKYVISADISKMYRQILIAEDHRNFQKIFWRPEPSKRLRCYKLNTLTYGTASAPYLAIRCLHQLAEANQATHPIACNVIRHDFYMDDLLTGANSVTEITEIQKIVTSLLAGAGFELRKWLSNNAEITKEFHLNKRLESSIIQLGEGQTNKTLGIYWNSNEDLIQYSIRGFDDLKHVSKRAILGKACQIYDPLGILGPIIITIKLIIQELWKIKVTWDETIPQHLHSEWIKFKSDLNLLNELRIPRHAVLSDYIRLELHGFSDSSERAYGACIYIKSTNRNTSWSQLLCAKSRVAPVKLITLPRLELCAALLLTHLAKKVLTTSNLKFHKRYFWTDSKITLAWIRGCPSKWKTFVGNRVSEIQTITETHEWYYVKSAENPADLLSRGVTPRALKDSQIWWHGPSWLAKDESEWEAQDTVKVEVLEQRAVAYTATFVSNIDIFEKFSSLTRLQRMVAYIWRFRLNATTEKQNRQFGPLTTWELNKALTCLICMMQKECFPLEYHTLTNKKPINKKSKILSLNPFLDNNQVIRVGGRIQHCNDTYDKKHPIILHNKHKLTELILKNEHERLFHCGPQSLLYSIRERFWPISGRKIARSITHKCVVCYKVKPTNHNYLMGNLPAMRVNQFTPFDNVGVDYGGPFLVKDRKLRGAKLVKSYLCLFVCMCTKAVHLELVSDLTSDAFIATLKRFIARRGKPSNVYSDNGTNFVGANNKLIEIRNFLKSESENISNFLSKDNINWHFIPSHSPNFGGIWEAGIKATKFHLKRVVGETKLTFEEMYTVVTQIEAILNSRPLSPLSSDPNDLSALTPAHFLVGKTLTALAEPNIMNISSNRLKKYEQIQAMRQQFWKRWHKEVISELQTRTKWKQDGAKSLKIGSLVVVKDDNATTLNWTLGRILQLHPGTDSITRVVTIKVPTGVIKRAVNKVCALPVE